MPKKYLWYVIILATTLSCQPKENTAPSALASPLLLVMGYDHSKTFESFAPLSPEFLCEIGKTLIKTNRKIVLAIGAIGSPSSEALYRVEIQPLPSIDPRLGMRRRGEIRRAISKIKEQNQSNLEKFISEYKTNILNRDVAYNTDINGFVAKTRLILQEEQFQTFDKYTFLYTDGLQDVDNNKKLDCNFSNTELLSLCLVGWRSEQTCSSPNTKYFESIRGFIDFLNVLPK